MNRKRLRILERWLRKNEERVSDHFNMGCWRRSRFDEELNVCHTAACACGWACTIPSFKAAGLRLSRGEKMPLLLGGRIVLQSLRFGRKCNMEAAARFFGVSLQQAVELFTLSFSLGQNTPSAVADRIAKLLEERHEPHHRAG